jgi:DNA polymerase-3 subunit chi
LGEFRFHHLERRRVEQALPRLLERICADGRRVLVRVASTEQLAALNAHLWTYDDASFLPHGGPGDGDPRSQPIYLTTETANPNDATVLILLAGADTQPDDAGFEIAFVLFDGQDPDALGEARARWKTLKAEGHALAYWREAESGGWERAL